MNKNTISIKFAIVAACAVATGALHAVPVVGQVSMTQNPATRLVTIQYTLTGDPAVVTVDFQTNNVGTGAWVSIGGEKSAGVVGDVNRLVTKVGSACSIFWKPTKADAWPNQHIAGGNFRAVVKAWATNAPPPYMIVDLQNNPGETRYYPSAEAIPYGITNNLYKTTSIAFRLVPASLVQWRMGAPTTEKGQKYGTLDSSSTETPHLVAFTNDWYMGVYPVTQKQHKLFTNANPSTSTNHFPETEAHPVETVHWTGLRGNHVSSGTKGDWPTDGHQLDSASAIYKARTLMRLPSLDLPTEAMWEYACRAGTSTATYAGDLTASSENDADPVLERIAWYKANSGGHTHTVGLKDANEWGFYDMLGNVGEFVLDEWNRANSGSMSTDSVVDPWGPETGVTYPSRIIRGGSGYNQNTYRTRAAKREGDYGHASAQSYRGYRLCCDAMALK